MKLGARCLSVALGMMTVWPAMAHAQRFGDWGGLPGPIDVGDDGPILVDEPVNERPPKPLAQAACEARTTVFTVDTPLWSRAPSSSFQLLLTKYLQRSINAEGARAWFCLPGEGDRCDPVSPMTTLGAVVTPVLESRQDGPKWRRDGHLRFYEVSFTTMASKGGSPGETLSVDERFVCQVLQTINEDADRADRYYDIPFKVSRRWCAMGVSSPESLASGDMTTWHQDAMGLDDYTPEHFAWRNSSSVALIDTGLPNEVVRLNGIIDSDELIDPDIAGVQHPHGLGMGLLIHETARWASALRSLQVLDGEGFGASGNLARALDLALFDRNEARESLPLIINLSLGWAPELEHPRHVTGANKCAVVESSQGAPVRYMLAGARQMDAEDNPVMVVGAAGNRPFTGTRPELYNLALDADEGDPCPAPSIKGPHLFYPARWGSFTSCTHRGFESDLVLPVSGLTSTDQPIALSIPDRETALVAPGEHVYVTGDFAGIERWEDIQSCDALPEPGNTSLRLPAVFSGTSTSSALITAVASRVYGHLSVRRAEGEQIPLPSGQVMSRFLYALGEGVCRRTEEGLPVRMISAARAEKVARICPEAGLRDVFECLAHADRPEVILGPGSANRCAVALDRACGMPAADRCREPEAPVTWTAEIEEDYPMCEDLPGALNGNPWQICGEGECPDFNGIDRATLGSLGPQPSLPMCPDCMLRSIFEERDSVIRQYDLLLSLSSEFPEATEITGPRLMLKVNGDIMVLSLAPYTNLADWAPGKSLEILNVPSPNGVDYRDVSMAVISTKISQPGAQPATDYSSLRLSAEAAQ